MLIASDVYYFAFEFPELDTFKQSVREATARELGIQPHKSCTPAHATVKHRLELAEGEALGLTARTKAFVRRKNLLPVEARLGGLGAFAESRTLYLALGGPFVLAWRALVDAFADFGYPKNGFEGGTPHVTLFSDLRVRQIPRVWRLLAARTDFPRGTVSARRLVLYRKFLPAKRRVRGEHHWKPTHTLEF